MNARRPANPAVRAVAVALLLIGAAVMVVSVFADQLNLIGGGVGFGWKQLIGAIAGLVMLLLGVAWLLQPGGAGEIDDFIE